MIAIKQREVEKNRQRIVGIESRLVDTTAEQNRLADLICQLQAKEDLLKRETAAFDREGNDAHIGTLSNERNIYRRTISELRAEHKIAVERATSMSHQEAKEQELQRNRDSLKQSIDKIRPSVTNIFGMVPKEDMLDRQLGGKILYVSTDVCHSLRW